MSMEILRSKFQEISNNPSQDEGKNGISLKQLDLWLKQANILDMNRITTTDTGTLFFKLVYQSLLQNHSLNITCSRTNRRMDFQQFLQFLRELVLGTGENSQEVLNKLINCQVPMGDDAADRNMHQRFKEQCCNYSNIGIKQLSIME